MDKDKKDQRKKMNDIEIGFQSLEKRLEKMEQRGDFKDENTEESSCSNPKRYLDQVRSTLYCAKHDQAKNCCEICAYEKKNGPMRVERAMTLLEFCNTLPKKHMVNKELQVLKDTIDSLLGWIDRNAEWGIESEEDVGLQVGKALGILDL